MLLVGSDYIDNDSSFNTVMRKDGDRVFVKAYATSGAAANTPKYILWSGSCFAATAVVASAYGYIGVVQDANAIASGCVGWVQIRGLVSDCQAYAAAGFTGSVGHSVFILGTTVGLGATGSAYVGNPDIGQCGVLAQYANSSTTADIFLTGAWATPIA